MKKRKQIKEKPITYEKCVPVREMCVTVEAPVQERLRVRESERARERESKRERSYQE